MPSSSCFPDPLQLIPPQILIIDSQAAVGLSLGTCQHEENEVEVTGQQQGERRWARAGCHPEMTIEQLSALDPEILTSEWGLNLLAS